MDIKKTQKTTLVFTLWTFFYFLCFRWFLLTNWDLDMFSASHWQYIYHKWWHEGWIIEGSYFWILFISLFLFIPLWILGFCFFMTRPYGLYMEKLFWDSIYKKKTASVQNQTKITGLKKKKSYKEVRPKALSGTPISVAPPQKNAPVSADEMNVSPSMSQKLFMQESSTPQSSMGFSSRELSDDFGGVSPFAQTNEDVLSSFDAMENQQTERLNEDLFDIMSKAGAAIVEKPQVNDKTVDYMAIAKDQVLLVLQDAEEGDWLADEERFNDEDPLWFSETSHRVSPITILKNFENELKQAGVKAQTHIILVKTAGNIINAEDMHDVWTQMNVLVARSGTGCPVELPSFTQTFPAQLEAPTEEDIQAIQELLKK